MSNSVTRSPLPSSPATVRPSPRSEAAESRRSPQSTPAAQSRPSTSPRDAFEPARARPRLDLGATTPLRFDDGVKEQRPLTARDALTVPAGAVITRVDMSAMPGIDQFEYGPKIGKKGAIACFDAAVAQANQYNKRAHGPKAPTLNGYDKAIQIATGEDNNGRIVIDAEKAKLGRKTVDSYLDQGYPVLVGVSYEDGKSNLDKMTDHFVTIYGRGVDDAGRLYYDFKDPGASGNSGRFYVDKETGKFFKDGDGKSNYVRSLDYEMTQVRTYKGVKVE
jgi:hypothetical protein